MANQHNNAAKPPMGIWMALALVMGSMIGSGVFLLPASLAPLGWNSVIGWLITVSGAMCVAAVFARLARALPHAGGAYAYAKAAFGPGAGFAIAWAYWISMWVGNAAIATGAVSYLSELFPALKATGWSVAATLVVVWFFTLINLKGAKLAGQVQLVSTIVKLIPLIAVIGLAAYVLVSDGTSAIRPFRAEEINLAQISAATILTLWAMLGLETATVPADKVRDPERTVPRATLLGTGSAGIIYIFVCSAVVLMLPAAVTAASDAPFAEFVGRFAGSDARTLIAAFGALSALGALNGWILVQGELPATMARDGLFPRWMAKVGEGGVPVNAHLFTTGLLSIVLLLNTSKSMANLFAFLILLASAVVLVMYLGTAMAAAKLMADGRLKRSGGFVALVIAAATYALWTIYGATQEARGVEALGWALALLTVGLPVYLLRKRREE